jgi:hypothetical protein
MKGVKVLDIDIFRFSRRSNRATREIQKPPIVRFDVPGNDD